MMSEASPNYARTIGVLLHPTALPLSPVIGGFGQPCREWIKRKL